MGAKFDGCIVYIYDLSEKMLGISEVKTHNLINSSIEIGYVDAIEDGVKYELLILSSPSPHTYSCIAEKRGRKITLKLFRGEKKEQRDDIRYKVLGFIDVFAYIDGGKSFELHTSQEANLINISRSGIRFKMKRNSLMVGDTVQIRFKVKEIEKVLTVNVVNQTDVDDKISEYGCKLL